MNMTIAEYQEMIKHPKPSKMRNVKTVVDGITFDSQLEANYYCELKIRIRTGEIKGFIRQPRYMLQEGFKKGGKTYNPMYYIADFLLDYPDGRQEIIDCKGRRTQLYVNKKKLFEKKYPHLTIVEVSS